MRFNVLWSSTALVRTRLAKRFGGRVFYVTPDYKNLT